MHKDRKFSVTGLGYVGLTVAAALSQISKVIGYDLDLERITELKKNYDRNNEISINQLQSANIQYTMDESALRQADFHILTVPTFIDKAKQPDLSILLNASKILGKYLKKGDIVIYESTVYPGATEEKCIPALESSSDLKCGIDFGVAYSPERINPADKEHAFENIVKVIAATDPLTLNIVAQVYASVIKAGVHCVSSIRVAEATKVLENTQRDINISLLNEIAILFHHLDIDMSEVLRAARTKWNFLPFYPGLVGGHCIRTNSYYLTHKAQEIGFSPDIIFAGRRTNEYMSQFIAMKTIQKLAYLDIPIKQSKIGILGLAYKENFPGTHDTKVIDLITELNTYVGNVAVHDPVADAQKIKKEFGITLKRWEELADMDVLILTVAHQEYLDFDKKELFKKLNRCKLIMDIKGIIDPLQFRGTNVMYWRL